MRMIPSLTCVLAICVVLGCGGGEDTKKDAGDSEKNTDSAAKDSAAKDGGKGTSDASNKKDGPNKTGGGGTGASTVDGDPNLVTLTADNTKITFTGSKDDGKHNGGFNGVAGKIVLSAEGPTIIDVTIETNSLFADDKKLTNHLLSADFFDVISFPKASLSSTKIEAATGDDATHTLTANLTLHSETHPVTVPLKIVRSAGAFKLTGSFTISRKQFGFNYKPEMIHDEVEIRVEVDTSLK